MGKFLVTEILVNESGKETKLQWDYHDRYPTAKEKRATRNYLKNENIKLRLDKKN
tara:strand:+ start:652 stop:816 length:165 start_codon:yes stop_codon:yes gene_type:complete